MILATKHWAYNIRNISYDHITRKSTNCLKYHIVIRMFGGLNASQQRLLMQAGDGESEVGDNFASKVSDLIYFTLS